MNLVTRTVPRVLRSAVRYSTTVSGRTYPDTIEIENTSYTTDQWTNVPPFILDLTKRQLHQNPDHPIGILKDLIETNFKGLGYTYYSNFKPVVTTAENFDTLGFPQDHPGRSKSDTYYINEGHLLRTHTSAHEGECFAKCETPGYFITADVYRKDEIDRTHYPAFHQMEGARIWSTKSSDILDQLQKDIDSIPATNLIVDDCAPSSVDNPKQDYMTNEQVKLVSAHLKRTVELLVHTVFEAARESAKRAGSTEEYLNEPLKVRWVEAYFPWTAPSYEIEVWWKGEWLECCGSGLVRQPVLVNANLGEDKIGWAFGVGLDRIAMLLFGIPDIRLFWTLDERFASQFTRGQISTFQPYSKYPGIKRDVSFWLPENSNLHANDVMESIRNYGGDLVESVVLIDEFTHPKTKKHSQCYRINYQSMDRNLTNNEINDIHQNVETDLIKHFGITIR